MIIPPGLSKSVSYLSLLGASKASNQRVWDPRSQTLLEAETQQARRLSHQRPSAYVSPLVDFSREGQCPGMAVLRRERPEDSRESSQVYLTGSRPARATWQHNDNDWHLHSGQVTKPRASLPPTLHPMLLSSFRGKTDAPSYLTVAGAPNMVGSHLS